MEKSPKAIFNGTPDPPPFQGKVVVKDGGKNSSLIQIFDKSGAIVFRRECKITSKNVALSTDQRGWFLLTSVVGLDNVIEIAPTGDFRLNVETGENNQKFWFEAGFLRNRAYPGKVVAMVDYGPSNDLPISLQLVDVVDGSAIQYWIYNKGNRTFENGYLFGTDRCVIEILNAVYKPDTPIVVNKLSSSQNRQKFMLEADPTGGKVEVISIDYDLSSVETDVTPTSLYSLKEKNNSPEPSVIKIDQKEISSKESSAEFYWENDLVVGADATCVTSIPIIMTEGTDEEEPKVTLSVKDKFVVGKDSITDNTKKKKWTFTTPITVPAHSEVDFEMVIREGQLDVPFTATVRRGVDEWEEKGIFKGVNFFGLDISIDVKDLGTGSKAQFVLDVSKLSDLLKEK